MQKNTTCFYCVPVKWIVPLFNLIIFVTSIVLIAAEIVHRNPIPIHLFTIHPLAAGVYLASLGITGLVAIIGVFVSFNDSHEWAIFYRSIYWLNTGLNIFVWQSVNFSVAVINRKGVLYTCELARYQEVNSNEEAAALLDFKMGATFGFTDCDQAVQAGLIGAACSLFFGCIFMVWNGFITNRWVLSLDSNRIGWRARNSKWNESLDDMASIYARDKRNSPTYSQEKAPSSFKTKLCKLFKK